MALERRELEIPLNGGLDTKQATDGQSPTTFTALSNLRWNRLGELEKRPIHNNNLTTGLGTAEGSKYASPSPINDTSTVFSRNGLEVAVLSDQWGVGRKVDRVAGSPLTDTTSVVGHPGELTVGGNEYDTFSWAPVPVEVRRRLVESVARSAGTSDAVAIVCAASAVCSADSREVVVLAYTTIRADTTSGFINLVALDADTWATVCDRTFAQISGDTSGVGISACEITESGYEGVLITYSDGTSAPVTITGVRYALSSNSFVSVGAITTNANYQQHALVSDSTNDYYYLAYNDNTSGFGTVVRRNFATGLLATHTSTRAFQTKPALAWTTPNYLLIVYAANTLQTLYAETFGNPGSSTTINTLAGSDLYNNVHVANENRSGIAASAVFVAGISDAGAPDTGLGSNEVGLLRYTAATPSLLAYAGGRYIPTSAVLGSFTLRGRAHFVARLGGYESTHLVSDLGSVAVLRAHIPYDNGSYTSPRMDVAARILHDRIGILSSYIPYLTGLSVSVDGNRARFSLPADITPDHVTSLGLHGATSVAVFDLDFTPKPMPVVRYGDTAIIGGGMLHCYDGTTASELSFVDNRPGLKSYENGAGSTTGDIAAAAVWTFVDAQGNLHRSAPGFQRNALFATAAKQIDVVVTLPPATSRDGFTGRRVGVELYLQDSAGTYRLANTASSKQDHFDTIGTYGQYVKFSDVRIPSTSEPPMYSDGTGNSELVSEPTPATHAMAVVGDRLWFVDSEDRTRVWFSKPFSAGYAPEFSASQTLFIGDTGVGITDVQGVPTILGERGIWQVYGEGPNALGVGAFAPARRLPHEVECLDPLSVCKTPLGVFFRGRRGIHLLGNDLSLQPVGLSIDPEMVVSGRPTGFCKAVFDELSNEVHVLDFDARHYVFNVQEGKWSEYTETDAVVDVEYINGRLWTLVHVTDLAVYLRDQKAFDDSGYNSSAYGTSLTTPWIRMDGPTGMHRIWEIQVSMKTPSDVSKTRQIDMSYYTREGGQYNATWSTSDLQAACNGSDVCVLRLKPGVQITSAFRLTLATSELSANEGFTPLSIKVVGGVRPGGYRSRATTQLKNGTAPS